MMRFLSYTQRAFAKVTFVTLSAGLLVACDNPAPGEGVKQQPMEKSMPVIVSASEALQTPDITTTDPGTLDQAEINKVLPRGLHCSFAYTAESPPTLAAVLVSGGSAAQGVTKVHGRLVEVVAQGVSSGKDLVDGAVFTADGMTLEVKPDSNEDREADNGARRRQADLIFELEQGLRVGYRGWYNCSNKS